LAAALLTARGGGGGRFGRHLLDFLDPGYHTLVIDRAEQAQQFRSCDSLSPRTAMAPASAGAMVAPCPMGRAPSCSVEIFRMFTEVLEDLGAHFWVCEQTFATTQNTGTVERLVDRTKGAR
jgi:hypothetical protein